MPESRSYGLMSSEFLCTPGLLRWGMNGYHFHRDRAKVLNVFVQTFAGPTCPPAHVFHQLLMGRIPYTVEPNDLGGTVVFTVPVEKESQS